MDYIAQQAVPFTATDVYLQAWGSLVGINRKTASVASGPTTVTFTASASLPAGTTLARNDGTTYTTTATTTASSGTQSVAVVATDTGSNGNCANGTSLVIVTPIIGITSGTTSGVITGGDDDEVDDLLRTRILQRYAAPPQGGNEADYVEWAMSTPGVTRAWVNPLGAGPGTVVVYTMFDTQNATNNGFPYGTGGAATAETRATAATSDLLNVANTIYPLRPVTALVYSEAPIAAPVDFTITGLTPNTPAIQAGISTALTSLFLQAGSPLATTISGGAFNAAIEAVPGINTYTLVSPSGSYTSTLGYLPVLGTVTTS